MISSAQDPETKDQQPDSIGGDLIESIAVTLGFPKDEFQPLVRPSSDRHLFLDDTARLVRAFTRIADRQVRLQFIASVEAVADQTCLSAAIIIGAST